MRPAWPLLVLLSVTMPASAAGTAPAAAETDAPAEPLAVQVLLDRAGFSPGVVDGAWGGNSVKALAAFQEAHGLAVTRRLDEETRENLAAAAGTERHLARHEVTAEDLDGGWQRLAETFHTTPDLLRRLNPGLEPAPGVELQVPNVRPAGGAAGGGSGRVQVVVAQGDGTLVVENGSDVLFFAPLAAGGRRGPPPQGAAKVRAVEAGAVCTESHGCVRLTNWDARRVAELVRPGTRVVFQP